MSESVDEQPKGKIAKKVISAKQKYFFPSVNREIEAESLELAVAQLDEKNNDGADAREEGDA